MRRAYRTVERGVALSQEINARGVTNVTLLSAVVDGGTGTTSPLTSSAFTLTTEGFRILVPSNLLTSEITNIEIRYDSNAIVNLEVLLKAVETGGTGGAITSVVGRTGVVTGAHIAADPALASTYGRPTAAALGWKIVTDQPYGAKGDGTTDDSAAIQAAINAAVVTNGNAFTFSAPVSPFPGGLLVLDIVNSSGGTMGTITWNAIYKMAGPFTNPASTKRRTISFMYDGTDWVETARSAADI